LKKESNGKSRLVILSLLLAVSTTSSAIDPNLVGHWSFEGNAADSSAYANHGSVHGAILTDSVIGQGYWFDSRSNDDEDYIHIPFDDGDELDFSNKPAITTSFWINLDEIPSDNDSGSRPLYWEDWATGDGDEKLEWFARDNGNGTYRLQWSVTTTQGAQRCSCDNIPYGQWRMFTGTYGNNENKIYMDGVICQTIALAGNISSTTNGNDWVISDATENKKRGIIGKMDEVYIYDRALSAEEILEVYLCEKAFNPDPADGATGVAPDTILSWTATYQVLSHDVYLGTDYNDVNDANTLSTQFKGNFDVTSYDPCGLDPETTYYWRVDEKSASGTVKGDVWAFTTLILWKNTIVFPDDCLRNEGIFENDPAWVKFTIKLDSPGTVYFQNSTYYVFHYDFATAELPPFIGMGPSEYYDVTLYEVGQEAVLGAVILPYMSGEPPEAAFNEYGIQFIRYDPYTKEEIRDMFNVVKANVLAEPGVEAFYFPTYEQLALAEANRDWFEAEGITVSSTARWAEGNACYAEGWALGELKYFAGDQIEAAYLAGNLLPEDILLTDGVPAEIPFVAGILSLLPSTPNSHVAILARTFGVPFAHLAVTEDATEAQQLVGHTILLSVSEDGGVCEVGLKDLEGILTPGEIAEILALKEPPELNIQPMAQFGGYSADTNDLVPADIQYFGGKAANFGILRDAIGEYCPVATAFSFDLWNEFLDQIITGGNSLREELDARLCGYGYPPSNIATLSAELEYIREGLFKNTNATSFTQAQKDAVIGVLQDPNYGFDINSKIRFRSSTNVEDSNQFTGAGLYDSYSGCLADDLDGDEVGPCICDPEENNERGVFRAIRKVFASFYNDNAFLERLRYGVSETDVGMALLVHHSFPDEFELANGVATLEKEESSPNIYIKLVTQDGAVSVANPEDGSIPEEVSVVYVSGSEIDLTLVRGSNLVILGDTVMEWEADYNDLSQLLVTSAEEFERVTGKTDYILDFEYKKLAPGGAAIPVGGLVVKQIREIPRSGDAPGVTTPFLIGESMECCLIQGEYMIWACFDGSCPKADVFAYHRLKSRWTLDTRNLWLTTENLNNQSFYTNVTVEYAADGRIRTLTGEVPLLPEAFHGFTTAWYSDYTTDGWVWQHLANPRTYKLFTEDVPTEVAADESPIVSLGSYVVARAEYAHPVPSYATGSLSNRTMDTIKLEPCPGPGQDNYLQERTFYDDVNDVNITTSYYWDREPMMGGITGALMSWVETVIEGYTTEPIVLHGWYSQTYLPDHHNIPFEYFVFEPQLEPGISQDILEELRGQDIRLIFFRNSNWPSLYDSFVTTLGFEDEMFILGDIEPDGDVDFVDFANFAEVWLESVCDACNGADLTGDGRVNWDDMLEFTDNWLAGL